MQKFSLLFILSLFACACTTTTTPNLDQKFGEAFTQAKDAMQIAPKNASTLPSHIELIQPLERFQRQDSNAMAAPMTSR